MVWVLVIPATQIWEETMDGSTEPLVAQHLNLTGETRRCSWAVISPSHQVQCQKPDVICICFWYIISFDNHNFWCVFWCVLLFSKVFDLKHNKNLPKKTSKSTPPTPTWLVTRWGSPPSPQNSGPLNERRGATVPRSRAGSPSAPGKLGFQKSGRFNKISTRKKREVL